MQLCECENSIHLLSYSEKTEWRKRIWKKQRALVYSKGLQLHRICILLYKSLNELSLWFENHIYSDKSALCIDMLPCNTILSSDLTTLIAQTSFYILIGESEVALLAASATAGISEFCSHVDFPIRGDLCHASDRQVPKAVSIQSQLKVLSRTEKN